jgi:glucose/arabinose dehydrogenase
MIRVQQGGFYGWPYAYIGSNPQPGFAHLRPDKVQASIKPDLLFEAHSSAMDIVFYQGDQFPAEYRGDAFIALKGSWNRSEPTGYKVVRVPFREGKPQGQYENFVVGFWTSGKGSRRSLGTARCARGDQGRRVADRRRHRRHDLASVLQRARAIRQLASRHYRRAPLTERRGK